MFHAKLTILQNTLKADHLPDSFRAADGDGAVEVAGLTPGVGSLPSVFTALLAAAATCIINQISK